MSDKKHRCPCGAFLFYIYKDTNGNITDIICVERENHGEKEHRQFIKERLKE